MRVRYIGAVAVAIWMILFGTAISAAPSTNGYYQKILGSGKIVIGVSVYYPPLSYKENGEYKGAEIMMGHALADFLGVKAEFVPLPIQEVIPALTTGKIDIMLGGLSRSLTRAKKIWFSRPYLSVSPAVLVGKRYLPQTQFGDVFEEKPFLTIWDLKRLPEFQFGVKKGSVYESLISEEFPSHPKTVFSKSAEALEALKEGKIEGFVHDSIYLDYLYRTDSSWKNGYHLLQGGPRLEQICAGLPFGAVTLKNQVDVFIQEMQRTGKIARWLASE